MSDESHDNNGTFNPFAAMGDALGNVAAAVGDAANGAAATVGDVVGTVGDVAGPVASAAFDNVGKAVGGAVDAAGHVVSDVALTTYRAFGGTTGETVTGNLRDEDGSYRMPEPIVDMSEVADLDNLTERFDKLREPTILTRAGDAVASIVPAPAKEVVDRAGDAMSSQQLYKDAMGVIAQGFAAIERQAAAVTVSAEYVIDRVNRSGIADKVSSLDELCLLRANDVARIANNERGQHLGLAFAEGAATGAPGFAGIPFNLVLSTFLYFRAVQSVALFYGYDVKGDADELIVASEVLMEAMAPGANGGDGAIAELIGKVMIISEGEVVSQVIRGGWKAMAEHGGVELLICQLRALANAAAQKALIQAGEKGLEESVFVGIFTQIGRRLTQSFVKKAVPVVGGIVGALFDTGQMDRILTYADIFYHKRFIAEKALRVQALIEGETFAEAARENGIVID